METMTLKNIRIVFMAFLVILFLVVRIVTILAMK